ncbi:MAG: multiheme c-type cytochrome, partial [candidate division Zixibacteria bacterium]|nr:multiheme c-type cytochrome [candidate division Zixibacteria bacterium]
MKKVSLSYGSPIGSILDKVGMILVSLCFFLVFSLAYAQTTTKEDTTKAPVSAKPKYVGSLVCKPCHNFEKKGKQYDKWAASKHAMAYKTLANEASKKIAKGRKIDDPQKSEKCLKCHLTGYTAKAEEKGPKYDLNEGVSC